MRNFAILMDQRGHALVRAKHSPFARVDSTKLNPRHIDGMNSIRIPMRFGSTFFDVILSHFPNGAQVVFEKREVLNGK